MDDAGQTALHIAVSCDARDQDDRFLRLLLDHRCAVDAPDTEVINTHSVLYEAIYIKFNVNSLFLVHNLIDCHD